VCLERSNKIKIVAVVSGDLLACLSQGMYAGLSSKYRVSWFQVQGLWGAGTGFLGSKYRGSFFQVQVWCPVTKAFRRYFVNVSSAC